MVQVGANDGLLNDPLHSFLMKHRDRTEVLLIEPQTHLLPVLSKNYSGPLSAESHDRSWRTMQSIVNTVLPAFGPQLDNLDEAQQSQMPIVDGDVRTLYGSQVQQQGHREVLHRLGPPAEIGVSFRGRRITFFYQALAFLVSLIAGMRCWKRPPQEKLRYLTLFGLGAMLLTGLVSAANVPVLLASMLAALMILLTWIFCAFLGESLRSWHWFRAYQTKRHPKPPAPPAPLGGRARLNSHI